MGHSWYVSLPVLLHVQIHELKSSQQSIKRMYHSTILSSLRRHYDEGLGPTCSKALSRHSLAGARAPPIELTPYSRLRFLKSSFPPEPPFSANFDVQLSLDPFALKETRSFREKSAMIATEGGCLSKLAQRHLSLVIPE